MKTSFETLLFLIQKKIMRQAFNENLSNFYICSLSHKKIVFKGLMKSDEIANFYEDLNDERMKSSYCIFHQRYSTNTFPNWSLAQPFRVMAHNGEINTISANITWMSIREEEIKCKKWGEEAKKITPILRSYTSDSASLDNAMEAIVRSGKNILQAKAMLIPNAWSKDHEMSPLLKSFYEYNNTLIEPWDGPAAIVFSEGDWIGAGLDRNGLRPVRYIVTEDGWFIMGSEVGLVQVAEENILKKGRLGPGETLAVNLKEQKIYYNEDINSLFEKSYDYIKWSQENIQYLEQDISKDIEESIIYQGEDLQKRQILFYYNAFKIKLQIKTQAETGKEVVYSMGDDTPLSILNNDRVGLYSYFKQRFAQVTNPPIDYIREKKVTSVYTRIVKRINIFENEDPKKCLVLSYPYLTNQELNRIRNMDQIYKIKEIDGTFEIKQRGEILESNLEKQIEEILKQVLEFAKENVDILILSDKNISQTRGPIPMELLASAVHHHLIKHKKRSDISILIETGSCFEVHNLAVLMGYGVSAVNSYLIWDTLFDLYKKNVFENNISFVQICKNYRKGMVEGMLKIMSKMGISVISSYIGGQNFEAIGLSRTLVAKYFQGTYSRISGIGLKGIEKNLVSNVKKSFLDVIDKKEITSSRDTQFHRWQPKVAKFIKKSSFENNYSDFKQATELMQNSQPVNIRDLFQFNQLKPSILLEKVETITEIQRRFLTPGMSHGALSSEAHEDLAIAMNRIGSKSSSGEGGENPSRFIADSEGNLAKTSIKQIASGRFGVTSIYLNNGTEIEIKIAQGAKPGEGGQLPSYKNTSEISKNRMVPEGVNLISPPPHHDIYSIEDLAQLIYDLKQANKKAQVSVKLVSVSGVGTIAAGVAKANADVILISGHSGGTGAAVLTSIKHAGSPWEFGLSETHQVLVANGLRSQVVLRVDGGLMSGRDIVIAACLGAEEFGMGTASLISLGCVMVRKCHTNTCPTGITTQDPKRRAKYKGNPEYLVNFFNFMAMEVREYLAKLGFQTLEQIIGRTDLLKQMNVSQQESFDSLDLNPIMVKIPLSYITEKKTKVRNLRKEPTEIYNLDDSIIRDSENALNGITSMSLSYNVSNINRAVGTKISGLVSKRYGAEGLPCNLDIHLEGQSGQSLGAWLVKGIKIHLSGDANDYVGKGLSGGLIVIKKHRKSKLNEKDNVLLGNTCLYGATSGNLYVAGMAGERFSVRNSGANAVLIGAGDHFLEYMTGGIVISLGKIGKNSGAGMTGGLGFVYVDSWNIEPMLNQDYVQKTFLNDTDFDTLDHFLKEHKKYTNSQVSSEILKNFEKEKDKFIKIIPKK